VVGYQNEASARIDALPVGASIIDQTPVLSAEEIRDTIFGGKTITFSNRPLFHNGREPNSFVKLTGAKSKLRFEPLPSDDPRQRRTDTSEAKLNLIWEPDTQLREYLTRTISYFGNILRTGLSTRPRGLSSSPVWTSL
jgi:hypothetical protein